MGQLEGKVAIVTGAGSGIGRASARRFAKEGAKVLAVDLNEDGLKKTLDGIQGNCIMTTADVSDEEHVKAYVQKAASELGDIDIIFANAGISNAGMAPFLETSVEEWQKVLNVNLVGPFLAIKHGAPHMIKKGGGSIVLTASVAGLRSGAGPAPYSASKAGVISLAQTSSWQLLGTNVRVNAICPGLIETGMTKPIFDQADQRGTRDKIGQLNPMRRYGEPDEIANMALFLASDEASYVNGQAFPVCGGLSTSHPIVPPKM